MFIGDIKTASPFRDLFPINDKLVKELYWEMQKNGFDDSKPIVLWESHGSVVIDGHTRLRAANKAGLIQVPVVLKRFDTEDEALEYAIKCQRNRRNLTDREIAKCVEELDKRRSRAEAGAMKGKKHAPDGACLIRTSQNTANTLGISSRKVERVRTIMDKGSEEVKEAVKSGDMTINTAYDLTVGTPPKLPRPKKGSPKSLELAAEEIASVEKIIDIINERLNKEQMRELIKRLVLNFSEKYKDEDESND